MTAPRRPADRLPARSSGGRIAGGAFAPRRLPALLLILLGTAGGLLLAPRPQPAPPAPVIVPITTPPPVVVVPQPVYRVEVSPPLPEAPGAIADPVVRISPIDAPRQLQAPKPAPTPAPEPVAERLPVRPPGPWYPCTRYHCSPPQQ